MRCNLFFIGEPLPGVAFLVTVAVLPFLYYLSMNRHIKKFYRGNPLWHDIEHEFSFYETDFRVVNRNNNARFDYQDIVAIIDKPETFISWLAVNGLILDKADCQPELIDFLLKLKETEVSNLGDFCFLSVKFSKNLPLVRCVL